MEQEVTSCDEVKTVREFAYLYDRVKLVEDVMLM